MQKYSCVISAYGSSLDEDLHSITVFSTKLDAFLAVHQANVRFKDERYSDLVAKLEEWIPSHDSWIQKKKHFASFVSLRNHIDIRMDVVLWDGGFHFENLALIHLRSRYNLCVRILAKLDPLADVNDVDPNLAGTFSDAFKDEYGSRPRGYWSYRDVKLYIDRQVEESEDHQNHYCLAGCYVCRMDEDDAAFSEAMEDFDRRDAAEAALASALEDEGPEILAGSVQCGRSHRWFKSLRGMGYTEGAVRLIKSRTKRTQRAQQRVVLSEALKYQCFDVAA